MPQINSLFRIRDSLQILIETPYSWTPDFYRELENELARVREKIAERSKE